MIDWNAQGILFMDLQKVMQDARENGGKPQRIGQAAFNHLHSVYPTIADQIRATEADCFHDDKKIPAFVQRVYELCNPEEEQATNHS